MGRTPTDLLNSSREKFALGQSRARRDEIELALLSFYGSLEDALRGNLLLHASPAARGSWEELLAALRSNDGDETVGPPLLTTGESERLRRMHVLRGRVAEGGHLTISTETVLDYQQFAAHLLRRYGVLVGAETSGSAGEAGTDTPLQREDRGRRLNLFVPVLLVLLMLAIGAAAAVLLQPAPVVPGVPTSAIVGQPTSVPAIPGASEPLPTGTVLPTVTPIPTPTTPAPGELAPGRVAYVRDDVEGGLALRERAGLIENNPVRLYLSPGTAVTVIAGPQQSDGYTWWQVRAANIEGWCAGEFLEVR